MHSSVYTPARPDGRVSERRAYRFSWPASSLDSRVSLARVALGSRRQRERVTWPHPHATTRQYITECLKSAWVCGCLDHTCMCQAGGVKALGEPAGCRLFHVERIPQP